MPETPDVPKVRPGGLVTVAYLKAQLDGGSDHLGMFMPLVLDVLAKLPSQSFTTGDIQEALAKSHGVAMPQQTVSTLLRRATKQKYLQRDSGRYWRNSSHPLPDTNVAGQKAQIEAGQRRLAEALRNHASQRGLAVESADAAQELLFRFLEDEQVAMLLGSDSSPQSAVEPSFRERAVVAEFVQDSVRGDAALLSV